LPQIVIISGPRSELALEAGGKSYILKTRGNQIYLDQRSHQKGGKMSMAAKGKVFIAWCALLCLGAAQIACGLLAGQSSAPAGPSDSQLSGSGGESQGQNNAPGQGEGSNSMDEQDESIVEPALGSDTLPCPPKGSDLFLGFDHALTINYGETSISHFLHSGLLPLKVVDDNGTIMSEGSPALTYTMEGVMSAECTLTSEGTMMPSAHGSCEAGVVSLIIEENWLPLNGEMVCIDTDGDVDIVPFNTPPLGMQTHSGENGAGEIFYLVDGEEGYSTMRPFLEGDGYHTWTLYTDFLAPVPLVP
jgi:hypothetical protein